MMSLVWQEQGAHIDGKPTKCLVLRDCIPCLQKCGVSGSSQPMPGYCLLQANQDHQQVQDSSTCFTEFPGALLPSRTAHVSTPHTGQPGLALN